MFGRIEDDERGRRVIAAISVVAGVLVFVHSITWDAVRYEDGAFVADMADLVGVGADKAGLFRASLMLDMLGSYLPAIPIAIYLWRSQRGGLALDVATVAALVYATLGSAVAAALAVSGAALIQDHAAGNTAVASTFDALITSGVTVWQTVVVIAGGTWWVVVGRVLRPRWRWFGIYSIAFGAVTACSGLGRVVGLDYETTAPATPVFAAIGVWYVWLGGLLWREPR